MGPKVNTIIYYFKGYVARQKLERMWGWPKLYSLWCTMVISKKVRNLLERVGCLSFFKAFASIWRTLSRVTLKTVPTSSKVREQPSFIPKRKVKIFFSRSVSVLNAEPSSSLSIVRTVALAGETAFLS